MPTKLAVSGCAACSIATVVPPMTMLPDLGLALLFAATENCTVPLPLPLAPEVIAIQAPDFAAVQSQPVCVVTSMLPSSAFAGREMLVGATA